MKAADYYRFWTHTEPSEAQLALLTSKKHGVFGKGENPQAFLATLLMGMNLTWDSENAVFRTVMFAYPKTVEKEALAGIQALLGNIKKGVDLTPDKPRQERLKYHIREVMKHLNMGSRVFAAKEAPSYWVAYGFEKESLIPDWLREGLIDPPSGL